MFKSGLRFSGALLAVSLVLCLASLSLAAGEMKTFSKVISEREAEYVIDVGGTLDPENVEITVENLGDTPVRDPWITANGLYDWFDIDTMVKEITAGCTTEEEKALAIWEWVLWKRFQRSPNDESALHPVRDMNCYGYGICGHTASWIKALCRAAGLRARVWEISGHTISEVFYNGGWHMLDGNVKVFYLARDNRTIASIAELEKDRWLIERTIHPRDPWVRQDDPPGRNIQFVRYLITERDNWESDGYDYENKKPYSMSMTLKPGEKLIRWWEPVLGKFESPDKSALIPQRYANGRLIWEPDLEKVDLLDYIDVVENVTTRQQDGQDPAIHIRHLQDYDLYSRAARFALHIRSPYPAIGGRFWCRLIKQDDSRGQASVFYGHPGHGAGGLYTFRWGSGTEDIELDLYPSILKDMPVYHYQIGFALKGSAKADPPTQAGVDWFKSVTDLQLSPHSLPALSRGRNVIRYRDSSAGSGKVRITHKWREISDNTAPGRAAAAVSPKNGEEVGSLIPALEWQAAKDPDKGDSVSDYQVMVSLRPDCRWPLSPALHRSVGSADCRWKVPESFLNPGTTYYWKVRARDSRGAVGRWSEVFSFRTAVKAN